MRAFYLSWEIWQTPSAQLEARAKPDGSDVPHSPILTTGLEARFPLPWSQYVRLLAVDRPPARQFWVRDGENPPVGLILCAQKGHDEARYALDGVRDQVLARTYRMTLPDERLLTAELDRTRRALELRAAT